MIGAESKRSPPDGLVHLSASEKNIEGPIALVANLLQISLGIDKDYVYISDTKNSTPSLSPRRELLESC
jgi:hypothetical protein